MKTIFKKILPVALATTYVAAVFMLGTGHVFAANTVSGYCASGVPDAPLSGGANTTSKVGDVVKFVACFLEQSIIPFLFALAIGVFVYGMVKFIGTQDSSEREQGKQFMLWGIVSLAVMFSIWGLVGLLGDTFGVTSGGRGLIPQLPVN